MTITYENFPLLILTNNKNNKPGEFIYGPLADDVAEYVQKSKGLPKLLAFIAFKSSPDSEAKPMSYYLSADLFNSISGNISFRDELIREIFKVNVGAGAGILNFGDGGQYAYAFYSKDETKILKKENGRYISVCSFKENVFLGFEEAYVSESGVDLLDTGHYENGVIEGGYLSFVLAFLVYLIPGKHLAALDKYENKTAETIYYVW
jgi:hypothetical protein